MEEDPRGQLALFLWCKDVDFEEINSEQLIASSGGNDDFDTELLSKLTWE